MLRAVSLSIAVGALLVAFSGCAKAPDQELAAAKAAVEGAKAAQADRYATAEFAAAQDSLNAAAAAIQKQNAASALTRNYDQAKATLAGAAAMAAKAQADAVAGKAKMKNDCEAMLTQAKALAAEDRQLLGKAPKAALKGKTDSLNTVDSALVQAAALSAGGDYSAAVDKAKPALAVATVINTELKAAAPAKAAPGKGVPAHTKGRPVGK